MFFVEREFAACGLRRIRRTFSKSRLAPPNLHKRLRDPCESILVYIYANENSVL